MELTPLGLVFLPATLLVALRWRAWLPALLLFSTVLQAASVLNVRIGEAWFGVTPYWIAAAAAFPFLLARGFDGIAFAWRDTARQRALRCLAAYFALALLGALVLPHLFEGLPVFALIGPAGFGEDTSPLAFGLSHLAQAANVLVHAGVLLFLLQCAARPDWRAERLFVGLAAAVLLVIAVGLYERLAMSLITTTRYAFWMNNPGYAQGQWAEVAGIYRISAPFSEPSYGSTFLAAVTLGLLAVAAFGRRARFATLAALLTGAALVNTLGSTGLAAAAIGAAGLLLLLTAQAWRRDARAGLRRRAGVAWAAVLLGACAATWAVTASPWRADASRMFERGVLDKLGGDASLSTSTRSRSNAHALGLLVDTAGLGAGMGSNRASSFAASLLSNVGVPGFALWLAFLLAIGRAYRQAGELDDGRIFALATGIGITLGVVVGIPDLNLPFYWMLLFLALLWMPSAAQTCAAIRSGE